MDNLKETIFDEAKSLISGERQEDYGDAHDQFSMVALGWTGIIGHNVRAKHVAACMAYLKIIREMNKHKHDNNVDCIGYIGLLEEIQL